MDFGELLEQVSKGEGGWSPKAGYVGGKLTRMTGNWRPRNRTGDAEIARDYQLLTARGRWLGRNNPLCVNARRTLVNNIIGEGIQTRASVRSPDGILDRAWNRQSDDAFKRWMEQADSAGRMHWYEMTRTNLHQVIESGDGFLIERASADPDRICPITFELIEPDQVDITRDRPRSAGANKIVRGIEFDDQGRRVAYYFYTEHPGGIFSGRLESERVTADLVIHLFRAERTSQTRGITWFAPIINALWDMYEYQSHEIAAAKVASYFVYMLKREHDDGQGLGIADEDGDAAPTDDDGNVQAPLAAGIGLMGGINDSLEVIQSQRPNSQATPWLQMMMQTMSAGVGLSYMRFTGDVSKTNFSSGRVADLQDRKGFKPIQAWHSRYIDCEVRRRVTRQLIGNGTLTVPAGGIARVNRNWPRWLECTARPPGWGYVDPGKQIAASAEAIASGLSTWEKELAEVGLDRDEVFETLQQETQQLEEMGLARVMDKLFGPKAAPAPDGNASDNDDQDNQEIERREAAGGLF